MRRSAVVLAVAAAAILVLTLAVTVVGRPTVLVDSESGATGSTETGPPPTTGPTQPAGPANAGDPPQGRIMLGATGQYKWEIQEREEELGGHLEGARVFHRWGDRLFTDDQQWARNTGHTIFLSIKSKRADGSIVKWRDIANAQPGSRLYAEMLDQARQIQNFGATVYVIFNHEPDARVSRPMGKPEDFVAAWRKLVDTYRKASVTNAQYVWVVTDWAFRSDAKVADSYYPGDDYVDHIGVDGYNWLGCVTEDNQEDGQWRSPAEILEGHRRFGKQHPDKGLMVLEWGSVEDPDRPGRKAEWMREATELFLKPGWEQYRAIMHYDKRGLEKKHSLCEFDYRTSQSALEAWRGMGNDPGYGVQSPCGIEHLARELVDLIR